MPRIVVVGGGWGGCAAALVAAKQGADVTLIERTDMLLGTGLVGGIFRNNGRFTAAEEALALGGGDLFEVMEANAVHRNIEFPGHKHAWLYNVNTIERAVRKRLDAAGVDVRMMTRITEVEVDGERIVSVAVAEGADAERFAADAFVDSTGTSGVPRTCNQHGNGCSMCVLRCHTFGNRVSVAGRAGITEMVGHKGTQVGAMSGACKLVKDSLSPEIAEALNRDGVFVAAIPASLRAGEDKLGSKCCQQYATADYADNIVLLDTGHAKLMTTHIPLDRLHQVPGFENARYQDPISGGIGNSIRFVAMTPRDDALKADGLDNLFAAGEKAGLLVGHTEAIVTGILAGHNAVREAVGEEPCVLPDTLAIGDAITHVRERMQTEEGLGLKYTFSGSVYFDRMKARGLYTTDVAAIRARVEAAGLTNVFGASVVGRRRSARVADGAAAVAAE